MIRAAALALLALGGCALPADPCPLPPERHPDAWTSIYGHSTGGDQHVVLLGYICGRQS